jgi:hypothetical protein
MLDEILAAGLTPTVDTDYDRWKPLHWIMAVPDVMERGGFDAIVGNPPFLGGQKLTGAMGTNVRDWFVNVLADGKKGSADLVAYCFLRAMSLLHPQGNLGLIATNTVAQGDTRAVGLRRMVDDGFTITRAIQSRSWPVASANLEFAAVWGTKGDVDAAVPRVSDDLPVDHISTLLEPGIDIDPVRLVGNTGITFQGCIVLGMGFVIDDPGEAKAWMEMDPRNAEVLFPYLSGEDLNSRPDASALRWVIDFNDMAEDKARAYYLPYQRLLDRVKPERQRTKRDGTFVLRRPLPQRWWQFGEKRPAMRKAIAELDEMLVITRHSKSVMPVRVRTGLVPSEATVVFATDSYGGGIRTDPRYAPSDVFDTFPRPASNDRLAEVGRKLDVERREIMLRRCLGLTKLYNLVNDPDYTDGDIARMREIHVELDHAVMNAYGWGDVELDHGFHTYRQMRRWTVSPAARVKILDLLLEENLRRAVEQGVAPPPAEDEDEVNE